MDFEKLLSAKDYIPINTHDLKCDMTVDYSIYHKQNGEYVLLCKDVVLTHDLIARFVRITSPDHEIFVPKEQHSAILDFSAGKTVPKTGPGPYSGYTEVKSDTKGMLDAVVADGKVPKDISDSICSVIYSQIETIDVSTIIDSINSVREVDEYLHTHSVNVALLNGLIGKWMNYDSEKQNAIIEVGVLHDIGKLKIPDEVLNKPARLSEEEFGLIKSHPVHSRDILVNSGVVKEDILNGVVQHHERANGLGYPSGLTMGKISEFARITAVSDVYDAMVAKRVYKEAHSPFEILAWFSDGRYSDLDITLVNTFLEAMTTELTGKYVLLSNGKTAKVVYVNPVNFEFPYVEIDGEVIFTSKELSCVSLVQ